MLCSRAPAPPSPALLKVLWPHVQVLLGLLEKPSVPKIKQTIGSLIIFHFLKKQKFLTPK
jgi:hypothetical protein